MSEATGDMHVLTDKAEGRPHPYHLVNPSPWPLIGAVSGGVMLFGAVWWMHFGVWYICVPGILGVLTPRLPVQPFYDPEGLCDDPARIAAVQVDPLYYKG